VNCVYTFAVEGLPSSDFYKVEVSHRGQVTYTKEQVTSGPVELSLGWDRRIDDWRC
jgi:hypothetical protein